MKGIAEVDNVRISTYFDMGYQKKGNGHTYNSNSGHAYFIGVWAGKVVAMVVYFKKSVLYVILLSQWGKNQYSTRTAYETIRLVWVRQWKLLLCLN